jgi:hypothetical protein
MTIGSGAMYVVSVVLPAVQAEFGVARADASLPYTLLMIGFGLGGILMGRLADRFGVMLPMLIGAAGLGLGFVAAGLSAASAGFALVHGCCSALLGSSATFAPLVADTSLWFVAPARHRGGDLRQRQLRGRRDLAADRPALRRDRRLAPDLHRPGRVLRRDDAAAGAVDARGRRPGACRRRGPSGAQR